MKTLISLIAILSLFQLPAQSQMVWKGGSPGQETQWNTPDNWSQKRIPAANDLVIIPNTGGEYDPVIDQPIAPIYFLEIQGGASLHIRPAGILVVDGGRSPEDGILLVGDLFNEGRIKLKASASPQIVGHPENIYSPGEITYTKTGPQDN